MSKPDPMPQLVASLEFRFIILQLLAEKNARVSLVGLVFACGFSESTMRAMALNIGCSPASISQAANRWCDFLGGPRPPGMKSTAARASYRACRTKRHWRRNPKPTAHV